MSNKPLFDRVALIGLGLIGSSLGHAMKRDGLAGHIAGSARTEDTCATALEIGFVDSASVDPVEAVTGADLIVICTPVGVIADVAALIAPALKPNAIVTDVGSVKMAVIRDVGPLLPDGVHLVPGHPVAGTEHSGPESGFPELFEGRYCILTPPPGANEDAVGAVAELWRRVGSNVEIMDPKHHDRVLAITSHLPHLLAYTIVGTASDLEDHIGREAAASKEEVLTSEVIKFSAGGFRDFTRIAASDPVMWRDIFLNNREAVLEILGRFTEDLTALQRAIRWGEGDTLHDMFERTRAIRRGVIDMRQAGTFKATEQETKAPEDPES